MLRSWSQQHHDAIKGFWDRLDVKLWTIIVLAALNLVATTALCFLIMGS